MIYGRYIYTYYMVYKPTYNWGVPPVERISMTGHQISRKGKNMEKPSDKSAIAFSEEGREWKLDQRSSPPNHTVQISFPFP